MGVPYYANGGKRSGVLYTGLAGGGGCRTVDLLTWTGVRPWRNPLRKYRSQIPVALRNPARFDDLPCCYPRDLP